MTNILYSILAGAVSSGLVTLTLREWISARLKSRIQHEYDRKLETYKAELKSQQDLAVLDLQLTSSLAVANKQIIAPMRQAWINSLRDLLAELTSTTLHYYSRGFEDRKDEEYLRLLLVEQKINLMLNQREDDHGKLEQLIRRMVADIELGGKDRYDDFESVHRAVFKLSREILKREWDRVKEPIPH